jgi:multiple sugar transport system substrate-binding protein
MIHFRPTILGAALATAAVAAPAAAQPLFWSTQASPIEETQAMREQVLDRKL